MCVCVCVHLSLSPRSLFSLSSPLSSAIHERRYLVNLLFDTAYVLPLVNELLDHPNGCGVIVTPGKELCQQVRAFFGPTLKLDAHV